MAVLPYQRGMQKGRHFHKDLGEPGLWPTAESTPETPISKRLEIISNLKDPYTYLLDIRI